MSWEMMPCENHHYSYFLPAGDGFDKKIKKIKIPALIESAGQLGALWWQTQQETDQQLNTEGRQVMAMEHKC